MPEPIHPYFRRRFAAFAGLLAAHVLGALAMCVRMGCSENSARDPVSWVLAVFLAANMVQLLVLRPAAMAYLALRRLREEDDAEGQSDATS